MYKSQQQVCCIDLFYLINCWCLTPLSAIFQLHHSDRFQWWKKSVYLERTTDNRQTTGKLYHLRLRVECTLVCNLQSRARTNAALVIGLYDVLVIQLPNSLSHPGPRGKLRYTRGNNMYYEHMYGFAQASTGTTIHPALILFEQSNCLDWISILLYTVTDLDIFFLLHYSC